MTLLPASSLWLSLPHLYAKRGHNSFVPRYTPPAFFDDCRHHKLGLLHGLRSAFSVEAVPLYDADLNRRADSNL